jgi:thioredoxin-like negative regulator of GroEL
MARIRTYSVDEVVRVIDENTGLILVHFGSPLASSCDFVRRELEMVAPIHESRLRLAEVELPLQDVEVLRRYSIEEIPTLILFSDRTEVERLERILLPEEFREFVESCLSFYGGNDSDDALE